MSRSPIRPDLKPLTAEELEALVTTFPDVMPHIYLRPMDRFLETLVQTRSWASHRAARRAYAILPVKCQNKR
jgi:hypothetical protein